MLGSVSRYALPSIIISLFPLFRRKAVGRCPLGPWEVTEVPKELVILLALSGPARASRPIRFETQEIQKIIESKARITLLPENSGILPELMATATGPFRALSPSPLRKKGAGVT